MVEDGVFEGDPLNWRITENNYIRVLKSIRINIVQFQQVLIKAIVSSNDQLTFVDFCQLFQKELVKAAALEMRALDDTDLLQTPAQKIITLLREV